MLDISKHNVQPGGRAAGTARAGRSPAAFCQVTTSYLHRGLAADIVRSW